MTNLGKGLRVKELGVKGLRANGLGVKGLGVEGIGVEGLGAVFGGSNQRYHIGSQVLILGEDDFSLTVALCKANLKHNVLDSLWSTTLDSKLAKEFESRKNSNITINTTEIKNWSWTKILYGIDATNLSASLQLQTKQRSFDAIFFTFPIHYPLHSKSKCNKRFMIDLFTSASEVLQDDGEMRIAMCASQFKLWNVDNAGRNWGFILFRTIAFHPENSFVPTDGFGNKWTHSDKAMWYTFKKFPRMLLFDER
jgi:hypothetical protein